MLTSINYDRGESVCNAKSLSRSIKCVIVSVLIFFCLTATVYTAEAVGEQLLRHSKFVFNDYSAGDFKLVFDQSCAVLYVDAEDSLELKGLLKICKKTLKESPVCFLKLKILWKI